jgi:hypothetical protein
MWRLQVSRRLVSFVFYLLFASLYNSPFCQPQIKINFTSALKMETVCFSETLTSADEATRRQNPEEHHDPHRRENLKSHIKVIN